MYIIIVCYKCGHYLIAKSNQKTRTCPSCSTKLKMIKTKKIVRTTTAKKALIYIRELKKRIVEK